jgi:hypothetical protein
VTGVQTCALPIWDKSWTDALTHINVKSIIDSQLRFLAIGFAANGMTADMAGARLKGSNPSLIEAPFRNTYHYGDEIKSLEITCEPMDQTMPIMSPHLDMKTMKLTGNSWIDDAVFKLSGEVQPNYVYANSANNPDSISDSNANFGPQGVRPEMSV